MYVLFFKDTVGYPVSQWLTPVNPSSSGGRDQEDGGLKPVRGKEFSRLYLETIHIERASGMAQVAERLLSEHDIESKP
jgi:hypothetical protein